ncbi:unnamed protein product [Paramecium octaurelia]|uniref:Uncharacterized protein n=1 Tax=Paramecium octaurelia TaxID=43137 RepID=A0A8S1RYQ6_PAROT|nr:unnamed protein product [Paramecium octaurelia]
MFEVRKVNVLSVRNIKITQPRDKLIKQILRRNSRTQVCKYIKKYSSQIQISEDQCSALIGWKIVIHIQCNVVPQRQELIIAYLYFNTQDSKDQLNENYLKKELKERTTSIISRISTLLAVSSSILDKRILVGYTQKQFETKEQMQIKPFGNYQKVSRNIHKEWLLYPKYLLEKFQHNFLSLTIDPHKRSKTIPHRNHCHIIIKRFCLKSTITRFNFSFMQLMKYIIESVYSFGTASNILKYHFNYRCSFCIDEMVTITISLPFNAAPQAKTAYSYILMNLLQQVQQTECPYLHIMSSKQECRSTFKNHQQSHIILKTIVSFIYFFCSFFWREEETIFVIQTEILIKQFYDQNNTNKQTSVDY